VALAHVFSLAQLANALALASLLTLLATGLALVFGLRDVMNFAHGAMFILGVYLASVPDWRWIRGLPLPCRLAAVHAHGSARARGQP
jgi:branched-subunit amino acid ABC-type transport system permease component